jgi:hypothetical protein
MATLGEIAAPPGFGSMAARANTMGAGTGATASRMGFPATGNTNPRTTPGSMAAPMSGSMATPAAAAAPMMLAAPMAASMASPAGTAAPASAAYPKTPTRRLTGATNGRTILPMPMGASAGLIMAEEKPFDGFPASAVTVSDVGTHSGSYSAKMKEEVKIEESEKVTVTESTGSDKDFQDRHSGHCDGKGKKVDDAWGWSVIIWLIFLFIIILIIVMAVFYYCKPSCLSNPCGDGDGDGDCDDRELDLIWAGGLAFFIALVLVLIIGGCCYYAWRK